MVSTVLPVCVYRYSILPTGESAWDIFGCGSFTCEYAHDRCIGISMEIIQIYLHEYIPRSFRTDAMAWCRQWVKHHSADTSCRAGFGIRSPRIWLQPFETANRPGAGRSGVQSSAKLAIDLGDSIAKVIHSHILVFAWAGSHYRI